MAAIKLVRNDTGPQLQFTITDSVTGAPIDLTAATVKLHFKSAESDTLLFSRQASIIPPETNGVAVLQWLEGDLDLPPGDYVGEVEVVVGTGMRETVFDVLQFELRGDFA